MQTNTDWRVRLEHALQAGPSPHNRFAQLASVRLDGRPANRTVVFRRFVDDGRLAFTTDARSAKIEELRRTPWAELCWYFSETREQFRLLGRTTLIDSSDDSPLQQTRRQAWQQSSAAVRQGFAESGAHTDGWPPGGFALLLLAPERVDWLDIAAAPHRRLCYEFTDSGWRCREIRP